MAEVRKVGVAWDKIAKNGKKCIKISLNKTQTYIAYVNTTKDKKTDPDYVVCQFVDEVPNKDTKK